MYHFDHFVSELFDVYVVLVVMDRNIFHTGAFTSPLSPPSPTIASSY